MHDRIETERVILRPFEGSDAGTAFGWFGDPIVMRFTPMGPDKNVEETEARLKLFMEHQKATGSANGSSSNATRGLPSEIPACSFSKNMGGLTSVSASLNGHWGKGLATEVPLHNSSLHLLGSAGGRARTLRFCGKMRLCPND
jgi:[ribosomal protein S5]-alanine N-acetyltransferase